MRTCHRLIYAWLFSRTRAFIILLPTCHTSRRRRSTTTFDHSDFAQSLLNLRRSSATFPSPSLHCTARRLSLFSIFPLQDHPLRAWLSTCTKTHTQIMSHTTKVTRSLDLLHNSIMADAPVYGANSMLGSTYCLFLPFFARGGR